LAEQKGAINYCFISINFDLRKSLLDKHNLIKKKGWPSGSFPKGLVSLAGEITRLEHSLQIFSSKERAGHTPY
jgi:hypothetical protein